MDENEMAQVLAEMADLDRMEREEAMAVARAERGEIFEKIEEIITTKAHLGRDVDAVSAELGTKWTLNELKSIAPYLAARPYDEATFDVEWAIIAAKNRIA